MGKNNSAQGNVEQGIRRTDICNEFKQCNVYSKEECSKCFARFFTAAADAPPIPWNFTGKINDIYEIGCAMQRKRIECALMIKAALADE